MSLINLIKAVVKPVYIEKNGHPRKRHKFGRGESVSAFSRDTSSLPPTRPDPEKHVDLDTVEVKNGESIVALRRMVLGQVEYTTSQTALGKYIAIDCEMVGVGIEGNESSLARVSLVNYTGAVILDVFVRQRERVVDYRTQWSGVRSTDLADSAQPFKEVQQTVADLIKDRILVGHAIYNDLKALLLSHPSPQIRDTQSLAYKHRVTKSRRPALRVLVKQELGIVIQGGEHNSVTDARATMALFRLYKKQWESGFRPFRTPAHSHSKNKTDDDVGRKITALARPLPSSRPSGKKRRHSESSGVHDDVVDGIMGSSNLSSQSHSPSLMSGTHPLSPTPHISTLPEHRKQRSKSQPPADSGPRKGISSGLFTVTRRACGGKEIRGCGKNGSKDEKNTSKVRQQWWKTLEGGKKGDIKL